MLDFNLFHIRPIHVWDVIDILIMWFIIYNILKVIHGTRAMQMALGIMALILIQLVADFLHLTVLSSTIYSLFTIIPVAVIVLFQQEIRKGLVSLGKNPFFNLNMLTPGSDLDQIFYSVRYFAERNIGAIIVFEQQQGLKTFIEVGIPVDGLISSELLLNIFDPKSNLHDGAVIIAENRIASAASVLPLSTKSNLPQHYGTRHRAGFGISEETDCVVVVVSEETGKIIFIQDGVRYMPDNHSVAALKKLYGDLVREPNQEPKFKFWRWPFGNKEPSKEIAEPEPESKSTGD